MSKEEEFLRKQTKEAIAVRAMEELLNSTCGGIISPEAPYLPLRAEEKKIIPVRTARRVSTYDIGRMRMDMEPDQINERMVSELLYPLCRELDEMGLIDLQITQVSPETLEYSIKLDVVKHV